MKYLFTLTCILDVAGSGSIRRSAERLNITPSALTRRIQEFEQELGTPLFDRTRQGMRLNSAGELFAHHARNQVTDLGRVRAEIAGLSGLRRGHVALVCSQAFIDHVVPAGLAAFRARFANVSFQVQVRDHASAAAALVAHEAELALILQPPPMPELRILSISHQLICAVVADTHPLAGTGPVRLRDCLRFPVAMPGHTLAIRHSLDAALVRSQAAVTIAIESGSIELLRSYVLQDEAAVSFQVSPGTSAERRGLVARPIDPRDMAPLQVVLGHLRGRKLSTAAAAFADQLAHSLQDVPPQAPAPYPPR